MPQRAGNREAIRGRQDSLFFPPRVGWGYRKGWRSAADNREAVTEQRHLQLPVFPFLPFGVAA